MGIKESVRPLLPPTSRAFFNRANELEQAVQHQSDHLREVEERAIQRDEALLRQVAKNEAAQSFLRYVNVEYAAKLGQSSTDILVAGWYGAENFGDELMLQTLLEAIPGNSLSRVTVLLWDNYRYPVGLLDQRVNVVHYPMSTWQLDQLANHFKTLVWGGGALIDCNQYDDDPDNVSTGNIFIRLSKLMISRGKDVICLGLSSNTSLENREYVSELNGVIRGCRYFSLRDPESYATLSHAGVDVSRVHLCEDIALANRSLASLPRHTPDKNRAELRLGLVPLTIESLFTHYEHVIHEVSSWLDKIHRPFSISLIPFFNENEHDVRYCQSILDAVADERVHVEPYHRSMGDLNFESYDAIISYKYHSALIALVQGTPTICVWANSHPHYKNKMTHLADLLGNQAHLLSSDDLSTQASEIIDALLSHPTEPPSPQKLLESQREWLEDVCHLFV